MKFLMTLLVLSICINAAWAGGKPSGGKPGGGKPVGSKPFGGKQVGGKPLGGKPRRPGKWQGWSKKRFSQRLGCWLYWSDDDCWYCYDPETETFVPCDE